MGKKYWIGILCASFGYVIANVFWLLIRVPPLLQSMVEAYAKENQPSLKQNAEYFWNFEVQGFYRMLQLVSETKTSLVAREKDLQETEKRLKDERQDLLQLKKDIEALQKELSDRIGSVQQSEQKNIRTLAETYTNMEPEAVVTLFQEMEDSFIVKIISFMDPEALGQILQVMSIQNDKQGQSLSKRAANLVELLRLNQTRGKVTNE